ncbi:IQ calmodulin binding motif [Trypanosoma vivax]|nr:IQ calmodulin binding motif [Trypanosoma vivax]
MEEEEEEERGEEENENGIGGKEKAKGSREEGSGLQSLKESRIDQSSGSYRAKNAFNRIIGDSPSSRRERRIKREQQEEHALRERIRKREEELARQDHFERTLAAIIQRTRNTAASKIQYTWCAWWNSIGRRRRELLNKRAEERARREKRRMALLDYEQRIALERKKREQTSTVVTSAPAVIKCGKKWLEKTACVRYVLRRKLPCEGRRENFYRSLVVKIQTVLRGFLVRKRLGEKRAARNKQRMRKLQFEPAEYAALVIQKFVRCIFARRERRRLASEFYDPIATRIQRWIRQVSQRRRALGIDKLSCWKRKYSACMIQRAWRAYLKRLSCFMERLRFKLDESRRQERHSAVLLQRVGRGFLMRRTAGVDLHRAKRVYTVMYNMEFGRDTVKKRKEVESRDVQLYVPTPLEEVNRVAEIEREKYHIGLFVECDAKRERESLVEALRLRPLDVRRRRAQEDHLCTIEVNTLRRERAARKIQREFRHWRSIRHNPYRDKTLLFMGMGNYHENFYQRRIAGLKRELEYEAGPKHYPEQTEELKAEHAQLRAELEELYSNVRTHVGPEEVRTNEERYYTEAELQRDERDVERQKHADLLAYNADTYTRRFLDEVIGVKALPVLPNQQNMKYLEDRR